MTNYEKQVYEKRMATLKKYEKIKDEIIRLSKKGMTGSAIHRALQAQGISVAECTIYKYRRGAGYRRSARDGLRDEVVMLAKQGMIRHQIYLKFKEDKSLQAERICMRTVYDWIKRAGIEPAKYRVKHPLKGKAIALGKQGLRVCEIYRYFRNSGESVAYGTIRKWLIQKKIKSPRVRLKEEALALVKQGMNPFQIHKHFRTLAKEDSLRGTVSLQTVYEWIQEDNLESALSEHRK